MNALSNFFDEDDDLPWHIDAKDRDPAPEIERQTALLSRLKLSGLTAWAVPNAGKRGFKAQAQMRKEGVVSGALDLVVVWNRGVAFIEMKNGKDMPKPNQRDMLNTLYRAGHHCGVFRTADSAIAWLRSIGAPIMERAGL